MLASLNRENFVATRRYIFLMGILLAIVASSRLLIDKNARAKTYPRSSAMQTEPYNNYAIFKAAFFHLRDGKDLYVHYPDEHLDLYKYTPSFALLFGAVASLPDYCGLQIWQLLNALVFLSAIYYLPNFARNSTQLSR